jgi:hypothetical protein
MMGKYLGMYLCTKATESDAGGAGEWHYNGRLIIPHAQTKVVVACEVHVTEVETVRSCALLG